MLFFQVPKRLVSLINFLARAEMNSGNLQIHAAKMYSAGQKKRYEHSYTKQKCQLQMGIAQYRNAATY